MVGGTAEVYISQRVSKVCLTRPDVAGVLKNAGNVFFLQSAVDDTLHLRIVSTPFLVCVWPMFHNYSAAHSAVRH